MEITPDAKLAAASRIMQGLLASGHYTETTDNGEPFIKWREGEKDYVVEHTRELLDFLIDEIQETEALCSEVEQEKTEESLLHEEPPERPWLPAQTKSDEGGTH